MKSALIIDIIPLKEKPYAVAAGKAEYMKKLIKNVNIITPEGELRGCIGVDGKLIDYVGAAEPAGYDEVIDGKNGIATAGFVNAHAHLPMVLFRGYAEDMALQPWLFEKIFPAEDKLTPELVKWASRVAIAEMISGGTTSFSDMYYFCDEIIEAALESGIKANIARGVSAFAETDTSKLAAFRETEELFAKYNGAGDGRIKIDACLHSEYTNNEAVCRAMADYALEKGAVLHVHVSETETEHNECIGRHGLTPTAFLEKCGCYRSPVLAAHCVWVTDEDIAIMAANGASAAHNPSSNLKLGSGVAPVAKMLAAGVNVCLGSDGCSSNNNTDMFTELHFASLIAKGFARDPQALPSRQALALANVNGAKAQGRADTGVIEAGKRADIVIVGTDAPHMHPVYSAAVAVVQSARAADVRLTMVDGEVLYKDGEDKTLDVERAIFEMEKLVDKTYR